MNLKEAIRILAQFDELFGDEGNDDDDKKRRKEIKWQFPEAWETEVVEADWIGIPASVKLIMKQVGDSPGGVLNQGILEGSDEAVQWALENGADISELDEDMLKELGRNLSADFVKEIVEDHIMSEKVKRLIYNGMFWEGLKSRSSRKIKVALENGGVDINKLDETILVHIGYYVSVNLLEEIIKDYATNERVKQFICDGMLKGGIENKSERRLEVALENGADINRLDNDTLRRLAYFSSANFIRKVVENYVTNEETRQLIYNSVLRRGIYDADEHKVKVALENGADINRLHTLELQELGSQFPFGFVKEIEEKYVTNEKMRMDIYGGALWRAGGNRDEDVVKEILATKIDASEMEKQVEKILPYSFSTDFLKELISDYGVKGKVKSILLKRIFREGLGWKRREDIIWALRNGVEVNEGDKEKLNDLLGPNWKKYLLRW